MNAVNSVSVREVKKKNDELRDAMEEIRESLVTQRERTKELVQVVKDTIVISGVQNERLDDSMKRIGRETMARNLFYRVVDPILFITQTYLRQLETNMSNLIKACIPLYFVNDELVRTALTTIHGQELEETQIKIAFETGSAIPMYINTQLLHISFLLNIPIVKAERVYQLKKVLNVGIWRDGTKIKINTPELVAYQNTSDTYLIPKLHSCQTFKDFNYLCPGKPFIPDKGGNLCALGETSMNNTLCDVTITRSKEIVTEAILINNKWLVSTNAPNLTITYTKHGTFVVKPIPYPTFTTIVPRDIIVTVGAETLFYVSSEKVEVSMEMINTINILDIPSYDNELNTILDKKKSHSVQLLIKENEVSIAEHRFSQSDHEILSKYNGDIITPYMTPYVVLGGMMASIIWLAIISTVVLLNSIHILRAMKNKNNHRRNNFAII